MIILNELLTALWACFIVYWLVSAMKSKKTVRSSWRKGAVVRILIVIVIILLFQTRAFGQLALKYDFAPHLFLALVGIVLVVFGLGFAVWARVHLGRNWGMPMSLKENPELVTTGPYKLVRHPIYTGFLLAALGSSLVDGLWWLVFFIFFLIYFAFVSAPKEEKIMTAQFPNEYPAYKKRTKMLIPFIF